MYVNNCCFISCYFKSLHVLLAPSRITNVTVSKAVVQGEPRLRVDWTAPQTDVNISRYQVQYRRDGTASWSNQVTERPPVTTAILDEVNALLPGTAYNVRVRAQSDAGNGEWSDVRTETTYNSEFESVSNSLYSIIQRSEQFLIVAILHLGHKLSSWKCCYVCMYTIYTVWCMMK